MNFLTAIREFVRSEQSDPRRDIKIFGYYPYYGFRRMEFEKIVSQVGLGVIARKNIDKKDVARRLICPNFRLPVCDTVNLINGGDKILKPNEGEVVLSYYSQLASNLKIESIRFISHALSIFMVPIFFIQLRKLSIRQQVQYIGDAIYYLWIRNVLASSGASELRLTVSYSHYPVVAAARSLGMRVVELQHGAISYCHIGYTGQIHKYFPDVLVPLSMMWRKYLEDKVLPLDPGALADDWLKSLPEIDFDELAGKYKNKKILFVGQETVHRELYEIYERARSAGLQVIYRNHPRVKREEVSLEQQLSDCDVVVGSYSTVLADFSGEKEILIAGVPGSEFLDVLLGQADVKYLKVG